MSNQIENIKILREATGAGVMKAKKALEDAGGDVDKAKADLMSKVDAIAAKRADRVAADGLVYSYIHNNGKLGSMILMSSETDFVARNEKFVELCKEIAMQICTDDYETLDDVLKAEYMRDASKTLEGLIKETTAKLGEKIVLRKFVKFSTADEE